jgi:type I restriction enzyme S subunit
MVVPSHWTTKKVKHVTKHTTGWTPPTGDRANYEGLNLWATISDLGERFITDTQNRISDDAINEAGMFASSVGSLLFSFKLSVGQVSVAGVPLFTNEAIATFSPSDDFVIGWATYAFPVFIPKNSAINIYGARLLNQQRINDAPLVVPPIDEQQAIALYLDNETARIDDLIREKDGLIELLREYRQAVIADHTTGVSRSGSRTTTGNVFCPSVPPGWIMVRLGKYSRIGNGSTPLKDNNEFWVDGIFPWLNSAVVNQDAVFEGSEFVTPEALRACHLPIVEAGSVLVALTGQGKTRGQVTVLRIQATINQHLAFIALDAKFFDANYVFWTLTGMYNALRMVSDGQGGTKGALTCEDLSRFEIPMPPLAHQVEVARLVARETSRIDELIAHTKDEIGLLGELRAATIADAVLGRVDVRTLSASPV